MIEEFIKALRDIYTAHPNETYSVVLLLMLILILIIMHAKRIRDKNTYNEE